MINMTREDAIKELEFERQGVFKSSTVKKALDMAISALENKEEDREIDDVLDRISAEIKEKSFTEEIFDEEIFKSTYTENVTRETAEEESVIETEIVKLSDIIEIIEKYKGVSE